MKYIKEYAFWNKDSDIAQKILKNLDELKSSDIINDESYFFKDSKFRFNVKGFNISIRYDLNIVGSPIGHYILEVDDVKMDVSWNQGRKIYNKVKSIYSHDKKEEEEHIKKDARISL